MYGGGAGGVSGGVCGQQLCVCSAIQHAACMYSCAFSVRRLHWRPCMFVCSNEVLTFCGGSSYAIRRVNTGRNDMAVWRGVSCIFFWRLMWQWRTVMTMAYRIVGMYVPRGRRKPYLRDMLLRA